MVIHADSPLEVCRQRDVKGLYARAQAGQIPQMTGMGSSFQAPAQVDLTLSTATETPAASVQKLVEFALAKLG